MKKRWVFLTFFMMTLCCLFTTQARAMAEEPQVVRIAFPNQAGLTWRDEQGQYSGYTYEYLQEIAQYTGWKLEFVQVPGDIDQSLLTMMDMVDSGELDLMGSVLYSKEMAQRYDYSGASYGTVETVLQVLADDPRDMVIDSQTMQTMRIAISESSQVRRQELEEYCQINLITPEYILCDENNSQLDMLRQGKADAIINTSVNYMPGVRTIARFAPKPYYFVTSKQNNKNLISQLNAAITSIDQSNPYFATALFEKYFMPFSEEFSFSQSEMAYLEKKDTLNVGVLVNQAPYQYVEDNVYKGISVDYFKAVAEKAGLKYQFIPAETQQMLNKMLTDGQLDLVVGRYYDYEEASAMNLSMTRPYLATQNVMIRNESVDESKLSDYRLAIMNTHCAVEVMNAGASIDQYETALECIQAVKHGTADYTYIDVYSAQYYTNSLWFRKMQILTQVDHEHQMCFAIPFSAPRELLTVLNKTIATITTSEIQSIIYSNANYKRTLTFGDFLYAYSGQISLVILGIFILIIASLLYSLHKRNKRNQETALTLQKHLQVYALTNDHFFEYEYKTDSLQIFNAALEGDARPEPVIIHCDKAESEAEKNARAFVELLRVTEQGIIEVLATILGDEPRWVRIVSKTISDDKGEPVYAIGKIMDIHQEVEEKQRLQDQAQRDSLTQLYNTETSRRLIEQNLAQQAETQQGGLLIMDVDYFKSINDTYGHMQGDQVLCQVANLLRELFRQDDILGRLGGDEFIIYMKAVRGATDIAGKCAEVCQRMQKIPLPDGKYFSVSIGAALIKKGEAYNVISQRADDALYTAKDHGRNGFYMAQ